MIAKVLFWASTGLIVYVYFGYPALLVLLKRLFRRRARKAEHQPSVTLLVAAHNEEKVIAAKIRNFLSLDYPPDLLEMVIASDGSTDRTAEIISSLIAGEAHGRVRLFDFRENRGKVGALNDAMRRLSSEVVAFSDASTMLAPDSIRKLVAWFADPRIGAVSGVYRVLKKDEAKLGVQEDLYWKYETFLKVQEAELGGFTGAHGSLYAIRRELYPFPAQNTINDDFVIPMRIQQKGYRIGYEPGAIAYEEAHEMEGFSRRVRIMAGNVEQLREMKGLIWPVRLMSLFCMTSHKIGRLAVPVAMVVAAISNLLLWREPFYGVLLLMQVVFYTLAALGTAIRLRPSVLRLPFYFCMINFAFFAWMYHALRMGRLIPSRVELDGLGNPPAVE